MKKLILSGYTLLLFSLCAQSQTVFSIKPGLNLNAATVSFGSGKVHPVFGLTFANFNSKYESKDVGFSNEGQTKLHMYMPGFGIKAETGKSELLKSSVIFRVFKPLIFGKDVDNGVENPNFSDDLNNIKIWGAELSYSVEYFLADQFSIGSEFGVRMASFKDSYESGTYTSSDMIKLNATFVAFSFNYHFVN